MTWVRCCLMVIITFQLALFNVAGSNITQDAADALRHLRFEIQETERLVSITSADVLDMAISDNIKVLTGHVTEDAENFDTLKSSIIAFASDINATECLGVLDISLDLDEYVKLINASNEENNVFPGLHSLALAEVGYYTNVTADLQAQFDRNCGYEQINCEAVSTFIVTEVERLVPLVIKYSYAIMSEVYILGYKLALKVELIQSKIITEYKEAVQIATVCLVSRTKFDWNNASDTSVSIGASLWEDFLELERTVDKSFVENLLVMLSHMTDSTARCQSDSLGVNRNIRNAVFRANQTINKLVDTAHNLHVDAECPFPVLESYITSSLSRALDEYNQYIEIISREYAVGATQMKDVVEEIESIGLEVAGCSSENVTCEYLSEKITRKAQEVPVLLKKLANAKSVAMYQVVGILWESGARIVRDVLEQLEVRIVGLKSCLQLSLY